MIIINNDDDDNDDYGMTHDNMRMTPVRNSIAIYRHMWKEVYRGASRLCQSPAVHLFHEYHHFMHHDF